MQCQAVAGPSRGDETTFGRCRRKATPDHIRRTQNDDVRLCSIHRRMFKSDRALGIVELDAYNHPTHSTYPNFAMFINDGGS